MNVQFELGGIKGVGLQKDVVKILSRIKECKSFLLGQLSRTEAFLLAKDLGVNIKKPSCNLIVHVLSLNKYGEDEYSKFIKTFKILGVVKDNSDLVEIELFKQQIENIVKDILKEEQ